MSLSRREFLKAIGAASAAGLVGYSKSSMAALGNQENMYEVPKFGNARILHVTDVHGQLLPVYFREPNVNLGVGDMFGRFPHLVGDNFLKEMGWERGSREAYAYTYLDWEELAHKYGRLGGYAHMKTVLDSLREGAGGSQNTLTVDGGDLWQGSGTALWTRGIDMVEASNILGLDVMVGHWEFTYKESEVLNNLGFFKGDFIGQNVRILEDSLFGDEYIKMTEQYDGRGLYNEDEGLPFQPYVIRQVGDNRIAVIGQAFPRTSNANPQKYFFPDWSFNLREDDLKELVQKIRDEDKPDAVILVSHNGMDVDLKMASRVSGIDAIFGGHTHDGIPKAIPVKNAGGTTLVMNVGCSGKFVGVMDFDIKGGKIVDWRYHNLPIFTNLIEPDKEMTSYINKMRSKVYDENIVESRAKDRYFNKTRLGKSYDEILKEELCTTQQALYRRGNFMGTWDQVLCNALRKEYDADFSMSAGVRWGTSVLGGDKVTMEDLMTQTAMTYGETYASDMTGQQLKDVLEGIAENLFQKDPYLQSGGDMVRVGGLDFTLDPAGELGSRITEMRDDEGTKLDMKKKYKVAGWAQVNEVGPGRLMWDVAADYMRENKDLKLDKVNTPALKNVKSNPGIEDYPDVLS